MATTLFKQSTLHGWLHREATPDFLKRQPIMKSIMTGGRIDYDEKGDGFKWKWRTTPRELQSYGPYATYNVGEHADTIDFFLPWSQFVLVGSLAGLELDQQGTPGNLDDGTILKMEEFVLKSMRTDWNYRLPNEIWNGELDPLNSGQGLTLSGITQSVVPNPATGEYAGQNRAAVDGLRNQQFAANSGSSGDPFADAWQLLVRARIRSTRARKPDGSSYRANMLATKEHILEAIMNKHLTQNTNQPAAVNGMRSFMGWSIDESILDDDSPDERLYALSMEALRLATTASSQRDLFNIRVDRALPFHVHEGDTAVVMRSANMQLVNTFPKAHVVITGWSA
jgi:hypothetical protein